MELHGVEWSSPSQIPSPAGEPPAGRPREPRAAPGWLLRIRERLHASLHLRPTVVELAESEGLHPVYLTRRFRETYGTSVSAYLRRLKVFEGARRLLAGSDTLTTIAHDLGFADQSHFCRSFQAALHMTPTEFRRQWLPCAWNSPGARDDPVLHESGSKRSIPSCAQQLVSGQP